jgi:hypothetical protein
MDSYLNSLEPVKPTWLEDETIAESTEPFVKEQLDDIKQEIEWRDS